MTPQHDVDSDVVSLRFRHLGEISRLKSWARSHPWDGRAAVSSSHRTVAASLEDPAVKVSILYTFDHGAHSSGWWRNSDYEMCWHLSMVAMHDRTYVDVPERDRRAWPRAFFGVDAVKAWWEPPAPEYDAYRRAPASRHTWHVRLFLDRATGMPIIPEGEVYTLKPWAEGDSPAKVFR